MKIAAIILMLAATTWAAAPWLLTTADLQTQSVTVRQMNPAGMEFVDADGHDHHLPLGQFVQMRREPPADNKVPEFVLVLTDGQRWAGTATAMTGDQFSWRNPTFGDATLPLSRAIEIIRPEMSLPSGPRPSEDIVYLANGDSVHGAITAITAQNVAMQTSSALSTIPWKNISSLDFASLGGSPPAGQTQDTWRITLDDGSILRSSSFTLSGDAAEFPLDAKKRSIPFSHITAIQQINGPVYFLASATPTENAQTPLLGASWPAHFDQDLSGKPLANAISVHAYSKLTWAIPTGFRTLHLQYSVPSDLSLANIVVRVRIDGKIIYEKSDLHAGADAIINLPLENGHDLTLETDAINPYRAQGWLTWLSPALIK